LYNKIKANNRNMKEQIYFDTIKLAKDNYQVDYSPNYSANHAILGLTFIQNIRKRDMLSYMRQEAKKWIAKYPVPLLVFAYDDTGSTITLQEPDGFCLICWQEPGDGEIKESWETKNFKYDRKSELFKNGWDKIFTKIPYRTQSQIKENADILTKQRIKEVRTVKIMLFVWVGVIPATWLIIQQFGPAWIGLAISVYAGLKILSEVKKVCFSKSNRKETSEEKERREMEHHHYHCKLNPKGFLRLKAENFEKELRDETISEYNNLKNQT